MKCPESGWTVPLIPSLIISRGYGVVGELIPVPEEKRYDIVVKYVKTKEEIDEAANGTVQGGEVVHSPNGSTIYRTKISTIRGDYKEGKENKNRLRMWEGPIFRHVQMTSSKSDFIVCFGCGPNQTDEVMNMNSVRSQMKIWNVNKRL